MSLARRRKRKIVVAGEVYWYRANYSYDQLWTDGGGILIVRDDRKVTLRLTAPGSFNVSSCLAMVSAPGLPWFASQPASASYVVPVDASPGWTPGVVAKVIAWCLDPNATRETRPLPIGPPVFDASTVQGFAMRLFKRERPALDRVIAVAEEVLDRPITSRPLDPVARDLTRSRRLVARIWETLAARGIIPNDWVGDSSRGFVVSASRALDGEPVSEVRGYDAECVVVRTPPSLRCVIALASDVEGALHAEALARESLARFEAIVTGARVIDRALHWSVLDDAYADTTVKTNAWRDAPAESERLLLRARRALNVSLGRPLFAGGYLDAGLTVDMVERWVGAALNEGALCDRYESLRWEAACERGLRFAAYGEMAREVAGREVAEFRDPFAPLMELWESGYGLDRRVSGLALVAPAVPFA